MLQKRPDWQAEWAEMNEHGQPLPNEMIMVGRIGSDSTFCFVPIVDGKKVVRMVVLPIWRDSAEGKIREQVIVRAGVYEEGSDSSHTVRRVVVRGDDIDGAPQPGKPRILDEAGADKNPAVRSFLRHDTGKRWKEKGYELNFEVTSEGEGQVRTRYEPGSYYYYKFSVYYSYISSHPYFAEAVNYEGCQVIQGFTYIDSVYGFAYQRPEYLNSVVWNWGVQMTWLKDVYWGPDDSFELFYSMNLAQELMTRLMPQKYIIDLWIEGGWFAPPYDIGGGGTIGGGEEEKVPYPNATYFRPDLPNEITPQSNENYCAVALIAFLRKYLGMAEWSQDDIAATIIKKCMMTKGKHR